jgi:purine nucleosidase
MTALPIIIDTDPGQDDAVAILLAVAARAQIDILGVCAVAGNVPVRQAATNALRVLELADAKSVPVLEGAQGPLVFPLETAEFVCGPDGLAGADLPPPEGRAESEHAALFIIETLRLADSGSVTLCCLGPLTNVALAVRVAPDIVGRIGRIVLMGGALGLGNMTPAAEFNVYVDPHAAQIVLGLGLPVAMVGLHVTHQAIASADQLARIASLTNRTGKVIHGMLARPRASGLGSGHPLHDPLVIAYLLWPEMFTGRDCHVEIETTAGPLRGRSTIDLHHRLKKPPNAFVAETVDADAFFDRLITAIATLP